MSLRACCVQIACEPLNPDANRRKAEEFILRAVAEGAELVLLPEFFPTGCVYDRRLQELAEPADGTTVNWIRSLSRRSRCSIGGGIVERDGNRAYDTLVLSGPDGELCTYRKRYPAFFENLYFHRGRSPGIVQTHLGRVGLMVCWDMVHRRLVRELRGRVELLLICSAWPELGTCNLPLWGFRSWADRQPSERPRRLACELGVPVLYCNTTGPWQTRIPGTGLTCRAQYAGRSAIIDASGETVASAAREETLVLADVSVPGAAKRLAA